MIALDERTGNQSFYNPTPGRGWVEIFQSGPKLCREQQTNIIILSITLLVWLMKTASSHVVAKIFVVIGCQKNMELEQNIWS